MIRSLNQSTDKCLIRSAQHEKRLRRVITQTPSAADPDSAPNRADHTRITHRDIQALWACGLPLRRRPRARTQAIFVHGRSNRRTRTPRLCAERDLPASRRVSSQLSQTPGDAQRDLRNQRRASASPRKSQLDGSGDRSTRLCQGGRHHRQHDRILSRCRRSAAECGRSRPC
jgi:hypothetical protein